VVIIAFAGIVLTWLAERLEKRFRAGVPRGERQNAKTQNAKRKTLKRKT